MDSILSEICMLVTAAFALTLVPGFRQADRSLLSIRDQGTALLVFLVLGMVEEATISNGWFNERIVAACAVSPGSFLPPGPLIFPAPRPRFWKRRSIAKRPMRTAGTLG